MAHISNIGASRYTRIDYVEGTIESTERPGSNNRGHALLGKFETAAGSSGRSTTAGDVGSAAQGSKIGNIREFPSLGTPSNIVNVPQFGQAISSQVQGQADAPSLEFTFNYLPTEQADLDQHRKDRTNLVFRVRLTDEKEASANLTPAVDSDLEYSDLYFQGTIASFEIVPALTDATQANIALTINGDFEGPFSWTANTGDSAWEYVLPGTTIS